MAQVKGHVPPIVVEPCSIETARSYAIRACMENGWPSQRLFLKRLGVKASQLTAAVPSAAVAASFGVSQEAFARLTGTVSGLHLHIGEHRLAISKTSKFHRRICRHCLAVTRVAPFEWEFDFITECQEHGPLSGTCDCGFPLTWSNRHLTCCDACPADFDLVAPNEANKPSDLAFQRYLLGRLGRMPSIASPGLDPFPVDVVVDIARAFGELLLTGYAAKRGPLVREGDLVVWGEYGYAWLTADTDDGHELDAVVKAFRQQTGITAPREPIQALGFVSNQAALHLPGSAVMNDLIKRRLGKALGYPISDLWLTDYRDLSSCLAATGLQKADFLRHVHDLGRLTACRGVRDELYVPVDVLWLIGRVVRGDLASKGTDGTPCARADRGMSP